MLELNQWFFVLLINFLALLFILNKILFKPLTKFLRERDDSIKDSLSHAREMEKKREGAVSTLNRDLSEARNKAKETFERIKAEGLGRQKDILDAANREAFELIDNARQALKAEAEKARQKMRPDVEKFSEEIVRKLIGA